MARSYGAACEDRPAIASRQWLADRVLLDSRGGVNPFPCPMQKLFGFSGDPVTAMSEDIRSKLLKLASGERLLRLEHPSSGLCLEKRLDGGWSVVSQTNRWKQVFATPLAREPLAN